MDINLIPSQIVRLSTELYINIDKVEDINLIYSASVAMDMLKERAEQELLKEKR